MSCRAIITSPVWCWRKKIPSPLECGADGICGTLKSIVRCCIPHLLSGKLNSHLAKIGNRAKELFDRLVKQLAEKEGITEQRKAQNQMAWVGAMNNIRNTAEETMPVRLIYA